MQKRDSLSLLSIMYLALPNLLFLAYWFKPVLAILGLLAVGISLGCVYQNFVNTSTITWTKVILIALYAFVWAWLSGMGGYAYQNTDYIKHNILFKAFATLSYPIVYQHVGYQNPTLCYYFAYYLPVGLGAKIIGIRWINELSFLWGFLGVWLSFLWIYRLAGKYGTWALLGFMFISGLDVLANTALFLQEIIQHHDWQTILDNSFLREYTSNIRFADKLPEHKLNFHCNLNQLGGAPQHTLVGWLATALIISQLKKYGQTKFLLFIQSLTLLWSPFVWIGLLPFVGFGLWRGWLQGSFWYINVYTFFQKTIYWVNPTRPHPLPPLQRRGEKTPKLESISDIKINSVLYRHIGPILLTAAVGIFLTSHFPQQYHSLLFSHFVSVKDWAVYFFFLSFEIFIWVVAVWLLNLLPLLKTWQPYFWLSVVGMVLATWVCVGKFNDFAQRVYIPSAFVFQLVLLWLLAEASKQAKWLWIVLIISTFEPIKELIRHQFIDQTITQTIQNAPADITQMPRFEEFPEIDLAQQYLGSQDSFYYRYCSP